MKGTPLEPTPPLINSDGQEIDPQSFSAMVAEWPQGMLGLELSEALVACVTATQLHGGTSALTLDIRIAQGESMMNELLVTTKVNSKPYTPKARPAVFFPAENGGLSRHNRDQPQIPGTEAL